MKTTDLKIDGKKGTGIEISLPHANLVLVKGEHGFVMCGYLNIDVAEKMGEAAAVVRGVKTVDDLLKATVAAVTSAAQAKGVQIGMTGKDALSHLL
jgi:uncharacterized protein YunC (DUF1805 family)